MNPANVVSSLLAVLLLGLGALSSTQAAPDPSDCIGDLQTHTQSSSCAIAYPASCTLGDAWTSAPECQSGDCSTADVLACVSHECGPTSTDGSACGISLSAPRLVSLPHAALTLSPVQHAPPNVQVNIASIFAQSGQEPQVSSAAAPTGPFELELLFSHLDYSQPVSLTIRTAGGLVSASYSFAIPSADVDGVHASVILDGVPAVVGARYELDTANYHGTFYPLQEGGENIPAYCRGAAIEHVCLASGICSDTAAHGLYCPGSGGPCDNARADPMGCVQSLPEVGDVLDAVNCYAQDAADCAGLSNTLAEAQQRADELKAALLACVAHADPSSPCQELVALIQALPGLIVESAKDALAGCGIQTQPTAQTMAMDGTCKALLDYATTVPGLVLSTVGTMLANCGVRSVPEDPQDTTCEDTIAQVLALPGATLDTARAVIESCGLDSPQTAPGASAMTADCQTYLEAVLSLPGQVLPIVARIIDDCTGNAEATSTTCRDLLALATGLPGQVVPVAGHLIAQCTKGEASSTSTQTETDCHALVEEVLGLPGSVIGAVGDLLAECGASGSLSMNTQDLDCQGIRDTIGGAPGVVLDAVRDFVGDCTSGAGQARTQADCGGLVDALGTLPATVLEVVRGVLPDCNTTQYTGPSGCGGDEYGDLRDYINGLCGKHNDCAVPPVRFDLIRPTEMAGESPNCHTTHDFHTERTDLSEVKVHPFQADEYDTVPFVLGKVFMELTYADDCSAPNPDLHGYYGMGFGWRGPTAMPRDAVWDVEWTATGTGSQRYANLDYEPHHFLQARPFVHFVTPMGDAKVVVEDATVVGVDRSAESCENGPWPPDVATLIADLAYEIPKKIGLSLSLMSVGHDYYCQAGWDNQWDKTACRNEDANPPYCEGVEIRSFNAGQEPEDNGGNAKPEDTYGGFIHLHAGQTNGTYTMDLWNRLRVFGSVQGEGTGPWETSFSGWIEQGHEATAQIGFFRKVAGG